LQNICLAERSSRGETGVLRWLKRESLATLAMLGAALTVLAQLDRVMLLAPWLEQIVAYWQLATRGFWRPPLTWLGAPLHHDLVAALTLAAFLTLIGVGARLSARLAGTPLPRIALSRWLDGMSWPSLIVFGALAIVFLLGQDASASDPLVLWGSRTTGRYAFALMVTAGYLAGDYIGHDEFHRRLLRLAVLVVLLVAASFAAQW
jgi:hypothetical protein